MSLGNRTALVTGGGRGIGEAIARRLADRGARVVVTGRTQTEIDTVATELGGIAVRADFTDRRATDSALARIIDEVGHIDILVNNAGVARSAPLSKTTDADWDEIFEVNVTAPFRLTRALLPSMMDRGWGRVINIASNAGLTGYPYSAVYCASKHALVGFTRSVAVDVARSSITVNAVCPGWVQTRLATEAVDRIATKTGRTTEQAREALEAMTPQRRMIEPGEVAHVVSMLCSDDARGIHGQTIAIDGGQVMH